MNEKQQWRVIARPILSDGRCAFQANGRQGVRRLHRRSGRGGWRTRHSAGRLARRRWRNRGTALWLSGLADCQPEDRPGSGGDVAQLHAALRAVVRRLWVRREEFTSADHEALNQAVPLLYSFEGEEVGK